MAEHKQTTVSESEFFMWRAVFAFALVDNMLSLEEQKLLHTYLNAVRFSREQLDTLKDDFTTPQNVESLYRKITDPAHKERFCVLARALVWCEGDMEKQEEAILKRVSCLAKGADDDVLQRTRNHADLQSYYQQYAKAGVAGLMKVPHHVEMRV